MTNTSFKARLVALSAVVLTAALALGLAACDNPTTPTETSYTVAFDSGGAGDVESQTVNSGATLVKPPDPTKAGHSFGGWFLSLGGEAWDFAAGTVTANITLHAKWTANQYRVRFDSQNGSPVGDQTVPHGDKVAEPEAPVYGSRILEGWYKENNPPVNKWDFDTDTVTGDITLYARWVDILPGHFLVRFIVQGGSAVESQTIAENGKVVEPVAPTRPNYAFGGWYKEPDFVNAWNFDTDTITATTNLYAKWTLVWTVTFNTQQGSAVDPLAGVLNGATITKPEPDPEREGFSFAGWHKEAAGTNPWNFDTDTIARATTLYAKWTPVYTVAFNSGAGSAVASLEGVLSGALITEPAVPTLANCAFDAWYKEATYTNKWNFATDTVVRETTLHAKWNVTVTFNANGGSGAPAASTLTRGGVVAEPDTEPVNTGMSFLGWFKDQAGTTAWNFADPVNVHTTLYAKWGFVAVTDIANGPVDGIIGEPLNIGGAAVVPANASYSTITWAVTTAGAGLAAGAATSFTPTTTGTVVLTATVAKGGNASGGNYTKAFTIVIDQIREVENIILSGIPAPDHLSAEAVVDLTKAVVTPANATNKAIVWTVKTAGAGIVAAPGTEVATISPDKKLALTVAGTLELTATIVERDKNDAVVNTYTQDFSFTVDNTDAPPGDVGFGDDTFIKLYANGETEPLSEGGTFTVVKGTEYYVGIDGTAGYSNVVWYLNGIPRPVAGGKLILDTANTGTVTITVEAEKGGDVHDGVYTFIIE
jgi:uncharacterized repeat protein (TIGR02543 family)